MKKTFLSLLIIFPVYLIVSLSFLDKEYFLCPIRYKSDLIIRCDNFGDGLFAANRRGRRIHEGIDLRAETGTPVLASRFGLVVSAKRNRGMGNYIVIKHEDHIISIYGHLSQIFVAKGQSVKQGEVIGSVGKTGNASHRDILAHLHFEIRKNGIPQDPLQFF